MKIHCVHNILFFNVYFIYFVRMNLYLLEIYNNAFMQKCIMIQFI